MYIFTLLNDQQICAGHYLVFSFPLEIIIYFDEHVLLFLINNCTYIYTMALQQVRVPSVSRP